MSWMVTMLGWFSAEAALASCTKRRLRSSFGDGFSRQQLDRHRTIEMRVDGAVHHSHAALADLGVNPVVMESLADHSQLDRHIHLT